MKSIAACFLIALTMLACAQGQESGPSETSGDETATASQLPDVGGSRDLYSDGNGKIIKTADYRFEAADLKKSHEAIEASVRKYYAYVATSTLELENPLLEERLTIRIPSEHFDDLLKEIDAQAVYTNYRKISTNDVAKEFVDLESRLKTKREVEQRYIEILRKKAGTIEDVLTAEQKIGHLHEEIEAAVSRVNFLNEQVRYSTINLEIYQRISQQVTEAPAGPDFGRKFLKAFFSGLAGAIDLLIALTYLWPLLILSSLSYFIWRRRKVKGAQP